jgi:hypothetical protein
VESDIDSCDLQGTRVWSFFEVIALSPKTKFYPGRLGTKQTLPRIEPSWILKASDYGQHHGDFYRARASKDEGTPLRKYPIQFS